MNVKHIWSVLCKESIVNQEDNLISLIGVLEELNSVMTPVDNSYKKEGKLVIPFNFELVTYLIREDSRETKIDIKIEIIDPNSKKLSEVINSATFPESTKRLRARLKIQGLPVSINGKYIFRVFLKDQKDSTYKNVSELPLEVKYKIEEPLRKPHKN